MRKKKMFTQNAWYEVRTAVNNREPLFRRWQAIAIFCRVFGEARGRFAFELRGFALVEERLSFYIRPADGLQPGDHAVVEADVRGALQSACGEGRTGHIWGDRYWSRVLEGEPPEEAGVMDWAAVDVAAETEEISFGTCSPDGVSPLPGETPAETGFPPQNPARSPPPPG
jgi:hypothetical protein